VSDHEVERFWGEYVRTLPSEERHRRYFEAFAFGDTPETADRLAELVMSGVKTATSDLLWSREAKGEGVWEPGDESIVLDGKGQPVCVVRTTELRVIPFGDVDANFVRDYGEGDRTLEWWRTEVWDHYRRECVALGREPTDDMPLICERFTVVFPRSD
jgi:uncharacterized protein YhfF